MNKIVPRSVPHSDSYFFKSSVVYLSDDGSETSDPLKAKLDRFGMPYLLRRVPSCELLDICISAPPRASLSPSDPVSRSTVLASLNDFSNKSSFPQSYFDKFRALTFANNSVNAFVENYNNSINNNSNSVDHE